jgi:excisionase family DNA binding protein
MPEDDTMLTVQEVAKRLRVNEKTVRAWINSGDLPAFPVGGRGYRISKADLDRFVEAQKKALQERKQG